MVRDDLTCGARNGQPQSNGAKHHRFGGAGRTGGYVNPAILLGAEEKLRHLARGTGDIATSNSMLLERMTTWS